MITLDNFEYIVPKLLKEIKPDIDSTWQYGYFYKGFPSHPRCFYMREAASHIKYFIHKSKVEIDVLDAGCGVGTFLLYLYLLGYGRGDEAHRLVGTDNDITKIEISQQLMRKVNIPIEFVVKSIREFDGYYDVVTAFDFLYEKDIGFEQVLLDVKNHLKANGVFMFLLFDSEAEPKETRHYHSCDDVEKLATRTGFKVGLATTRKVSNNQSTIYILQHGI